MIGDLWWETVQDDRELYTSVLDSMMSYFFERQIGYYPEMASVYPVDVTYLGKLSGFSATIVPENMDLGYFQLRKNEPPSYEILSGAGIAFAALLLIIPGFLTDIMGFLLIFPFTRKMIFKKFSKKFKNEKNLKKDYIEGDFEDIEDDNDRKI